MNGTKVHKNLVIQAQLMGAVEAYVALNKRKGRRNVSEFTEGLWLSHLRKHAPSLVPALKKD